MPIVYKVDISIVLYQLIRLLHYIVDIEIVTDRTILFHILECEVDTILGGPLVRIASFLDNQRDLGTEKRIRTDKSNCFRYYDPQIPS